MGLIPKLTDAGENLLLSALAGNTNIYFTKIAIGNGDEPNDVKALNGIVSAKIEMAIEAKERSAKYLILKSSFDNSEITEGFNWTETGVYAKDDDGNEILYAYCNSGNQYDYIPTGISGRTLETSLSIAVTVKDLDDGAINIELSGGALYVTEKQFDEVISEFKAGALGVSYDGKAQAIVFGTGGGTGTADEAAVAEAAELNNGVTAAIDEVASAYTVSEEDVDKALAEVGV